MIVGTSARRRGRDRLPEALLARSAAVKAAADATAWVFGILAAEVVRYDLTLKGLELRPRELVLAIAVVAAFHIVLGVATGLYRNHWVFGSFEEMACVAATTAGTLSMAIVVDAVTHERPAPAVLPFAAATAALVVMGSTRYAWRIVEHERLRPSRSTARRMLVFGAGEGANQFLYSVLRNPDAGYVPVALLDDDPGKRNRRIMGIRVVGTRHNIAEAAARLDASLLVIAVPSAKAELVRSVTDAATGAGIETRVLPTTRELLGATVTVGDLRTPTITDLLGRRPVQTDLSEAARYVSGRRVLVTGAGGSIGSELCRQLATLDPAELMMLDRDESALHAVQLSIDGRGMLDSPGLILADIRDGAALQETFLRRRPEVVFHAAALKHLSLLEAHPGEAVKSNVWGTMNVLKAARRAGTTHFINISTDKAADPTSCLGLSKRLAERVTAEVACEVPDGRFLSVRFGNVLGSRGSVLHAFRAQIEAGGPVLVTHPEVTRYFMTVEEAVQLVLQAGALGDAGRALVLDMGRPVRIAEVAERVVRDSGRDVDIDFTGLRPGEKLHEALFGSQERPAPTEHPLINQVSVPRLSTAAAWTLPTEGGEDLIRSAMGDLCSSPANEDGWPIDLTVFDEDQLFLHDPSASSWAQGGQQ